MKEVFDQINRQGERLTALESLFQSFQAVVTGALDSIKTDVSGLSKRQTESVKTPWPTLISLAGLIVVGGGVIGGLSLKPQQEADKRHEEMMAQMRASQDRMDERFFEFVTGNGHPTSQMYREMHREEFLRLRGQFDELENIVMAHIASEGHDTALTRIYALERQDEELDAMLQRELRQNDQILRQEYLGLYESLKENDDDLDQMLQREMRLLADPLEGRVTRIERSFEMHDRDVAGLNAGQSATIEGLTERIRQLEALNIRQEVRP